MNRRNFLAGFSSFSSLAFACRASLAADPSMAPQRKPFADIFPAKKPVLSVTPHSDGSPRTVLIDPGHGGKDPGAIGQSGLTEKEVNLAIGIKLHSALNAISGVSASITRTEDHYLSLRERSQLTERASPDLFVSIHADSAPNKEANGLSVYTLSKSGSDALSRELAKNENLIPEGAYNEEVASVLFDMMDRYKGHSSSIYQDAIINAVSNGHSLLERPARSANFFVLRTPGIPSCLIETGFLSNREDELLLANDGVRQSIANLIANGIAAGLEKQSY